MQHTTTLAQAVAGIEETSHSLARVDAPQALKEEFPRAFVSEMMISAIYNRFIGSFQLMFCSMSIPS
jgi:hypothetical protein